MKNNQYILFFRNGTGAIRELPNGKVDLMVRGSEFANYNSKCHDDIRLITDWQGEPMFHIIVSMLLGIKKLRECQNISFQIMGQQSQRDFSFT